MANAFFFCPLPWVSIAAGSTASGYSASDLSPYPVPRMGRVWRSQPSTLTEGFDIDLGADQPVDVIALFGIGAANGPPGTGWEININLATAAQGPFTGAQYSTSWQPFLQSGVLPVSGRGKHMWVAAVDAPSVSRYVRIQFRNLAGAQLQISLVAIGQRFQPARNYQYGAAFGVRDLGTVDYSPRGVVLRRPGAKLRGMGLTFASVRREEVEDSLQRLFERVGNTDPVVLVSDPADHPQRQNRMGIGHLTGNLGTIHRVPGFFQAEVNFVAVD
jgi:hypothetical protein